MSDPLPPNPGPWWAPPDRSPPTPMPWWVLPGLALIAEIIFSAGLALAFIRGNETQQTTMLTAAIGLSATAFGFFYQSSLGSKQAAATIAEKLNGASQDKPVAIAVSGVNEDRK